MSGIKNVAYRVNAGGAAVYLALVYDEAGDAITQAGLSAISRTITDTVTGLATTASVAVADTVYDTLQADAVLWSAGGAAQSYNFRDTLLGASIPARRRYRLQYSFTSAAGVVFKSAPVDLVGD